MSLRRTTEPGSEPLTLAEAKLHLRVETAVTDDDALITALIKAARQQAENRLQRTLISSGWTLALDDFAAAIRLPMPRATAITSVKYIDANGVQQTIASTDYSLDNASEIANWLLPAYGLDWPAARAQANAVEIVYSAGWADAAAVPQELKQWLLLAVGAWYGQREALAERQVFDLPRSFVDGLLDGWRVLEV